MTAFSKRLKFFIDRRGIKQASVAEQASIDQGSLSKALSGKQSLDDAGILRVAQALRLSDTETSELLVLGKLYGLEGKPFETWSSIAAAALKVQDASPATFKEKGFHEVKVLAHVRAGAGEEHSHDHGSHAHADTAH